MSKVACDTVDISICRVGRQYPLRTDYQSAGADRWATIPLPAEGFHTGRIDSLYWTRSRNDGRRRPAASHTSGESALPPHLSIAGRTSAENQ